MQKRLFRSKHSRILLGVCGGIGEYFGIDPVIIRVIAVLLMIPGIFPAIIAYFVLAIIVPLEGSQSTTPRDNIRENVADLRNTSVGIGEEIRTAFQKPEAKPDEPNQTAQGTPVTPSPPVHTDTNRSVWLLGLIIIIIGLFFLIINLFGWIWSRLWPISLILVGIIIILLVVKRK